MTAHNSSHYAERLGDFVLLRLLATGKPPTKSTLDKDLRNYFAEPAAMTSAQWNSLLDGAIEELTSADWITSSPFQLTEQGRAKAMGVISVKSLRTQVRWQTLRNRYLVAKALGITPSSKTEWDRLSTADGLRAAALTKHYDLPLGPVPTPARTLDALAWLQLKQCHEEDLPSDSGFTRDAVLRSTLLGGRPARSTLSALAAAVTGASSSLADKVREAVICNWIHGQQTSSMDPNQFDLRAFAKRVVDLARHTSSGRYGDHKVFISHVWNRFSQEGTAQGMTRDQFDRHLVEANREDLLALTRADFISDMAPDDVDQSEIQLSNSSVHFIRTDTETA